MEALDILNKLECAKNTLDNLTKELAEVTKEKSIAEKEYNIETEKQIERARAEKIQSTLIKDVVKARMAEKYFKVRILEVKETFKTFIAAGKYLQKYYGK